MSIRPVTKIPRCCLLQNQLFHEGRMRVARAISPPDSPAESSSRSPSPTMQQPLDSPDEKRRRFDSEDYPDDDEESED